MSREPLNELGFDAEYGVLGLLIVNGASICEPPGMTAAWFSTYEARVIYDAIQSVRRTGITPDAISVRNHLQQTGRLEKAGGEDFLMEVCQALIVPSALPDMCAVLENNYARRKVKEISAWLAKSANMESLTAGEIASKLLEASALISGTTGSPVISIGEVLHEGEDTGVTTGYQNLDMYMSTGGYAAGQTNVISAYHKGGKTSFMLSSALKQLRAGKSVLYATFADLNQKQIKRRLLKNLCGWSRPPANLDLLTEYDEAVTFLKDCAMEVYDASKLTTGHDIETFGAWLRANHERKRYDCVFVDYAQKLRSARRMNKFEESDYCSDVLTRLAAGTELPIVVGSQITIGKPGEETKTKNSRQWEEDAGWVLRLKTEGQIVNIEIPYSRFGPSGETTLIWNSERVRMEAAA